MDIEKYRLTDEEIAEHTDIAGIRLISKTIARNIAEAQLSKVLPLIEQAKQESEARLELLRRLTDRCEQLKQEAEEAKKEERERIINELSKYDLGYGGTPYKLVNIDWFKKALSQDKEIGE